MGAGLTGLTGLASAEGGSRGFVSYAGEAVEVDEPPEIVDEVGHADLQPGAGDSNGSDEEIHLVFLHREDVLDAGADLDLIALARRVVSGSSRRGGFLRWMRLTKPFLSRNASFAFER